MTPRDFALVEHHRARATALRARATFHHLTADAERKHPDRSDLHAASVRLHEALADAARRDAEAANDLADRIATGEPEMLEVTA